MPYSVGDRVKVCLHADQLPAINEELTMTGSVCGRDGDRYDIEVDDPVEELKVIRAIPEDCVSMMGANDERGNWDAQGRKVSAFGRDGQPIYADGSHGHHDAHDTAVGQGAGNPAQMAPNQGGNRGMSGQSQGNLGMGDSTPTA